MVPVLPVELWEPIFSFVFELPFAIRKAALEALSLVNHTFRVSSQRLIFSHVQLTLEPWHRSIPRGSSLPPPNIFSEFLSLIRKSRHIPPLVTSLAVGCDLKKECDQVPEILSLLPNIWDLHINFHARFRSPLGFPMPQEIMTAFQTYTFPTLVSLRLEHLRGFSLWWILEACHHLEYLAMCGSFVAPLEDAEVIDRPLHPLRSLDIEFSSQESIHASLHGLAQARCRIRSLVLRTLVDRTALGFYAPFLEHAASTLTHLEIRSFHFTFKQFDRYYLSNLPHLISLTVVFPPLYYQRSPILSFFITVLGSPTTPHPLQQVQVALDKDSEEEHHEMLQELHEDRWYQFDRSLTQNPYLEQLNSVVFLVDMGSTVRLENLKEGLEERLPFAAEKGMLSYQHVTEA